MDEDKEHIIHQNISGGYLWINRTISAIKMGITMMPIKMTLMLQTKEPVV